MSIELVVTTSSPTVTTDPSTYQYNDTFGHASDVFEKLMGQDYQLTNFKSAKAVLEELGKTVQHFSGFLSGNQRLKTWLESYVDLLFTVSATLWETTEEVSLTHDSPLPCCCTLNVSFSSASLTRKNDL
jgi:hypothetical protein